MIHTPHMAIVKLNDLCVQVTDGTHDSPKLQPDGVPFIKGKHISNGSIDFKYCDYITFEDHLKVIARSKPEKGDILFSNIGSVGDAAFINSSQEFSIKNVALFKPNPSVIDNRYLYYHVIGPAFRGSLLNKRSGSAQPFLCLDVLRNHELTIHKDILIQHKIASVLSAYDDLIENNTRRIKILEEMAQSIYRHWFVDFKFPGHKKAKFVNSPLGKIPQGWEAKKIGDIAEEVRRSVDPSEIADDTPYIGLEHLPRKSIALGDWGFAREVQSSKLAFEKGEILFGKIRPYFHKVGVAPLAGVCSSDTIVIKPMNEMYFGAVLGCVSSEAFVNHASQTSHGTKMPRANWKVLVKYPMMTPPDSLLAGFNKHMQDTVDLIHNLIFKNRNLRRTRDLLLPKLISGEIEV